MLSDRLPGARVGVRKSWVHGPRPGIITGRPNYDTPSHALHHLPGAWIWKSFVQCCQDKHFYVVLEHVIRYTGNYLF